MNMRTGLGRDLLSKVIDWRLTECLALRTPRGVEQKPEVVSTIKAARAAFTNAVAVIATNKKPGVDGPSLTATDAEIILAPLVASLVFWGNKSWTHNHDLRAERASMLSFARAWTPQVARYCIEPADELATEVDMLAMFVRDHDMTLAGLDDSQRCAFRRRTTDPTAHRAQLMRFIASLIDEQTLVTETKSAIEREFPNVDEARIIASDANLNDPVFIAAFLGNARERMMRRIPDVLATIWPRG